MCLTMSLKLSASIRTERARSGSSATRLSAYGTTYVVSSHRIRAGKILLDQSMKEQASSVQVIPGSFRHAGLSGHGHRRELQNVHTMRARLTPQGHDQNTTRCGSGGIVNVGSGTSQVLSAWSVSYEVAELRTGGARRPPTDLLPSDNFSSCSIRAHEKAKRYAKTFLNVSCSCVRCVRTCWHNNENSGSSV